MVASTIIERVVKNAPIGVRFRDAATGRLVSDGLGVTVVPARGRRVAATRSPTGTYVGQGIPGLTRFELDAEAPDNATAPAIRIEVRDLTGAYHDFSFDTFPFTGLAYPLVSSPLSPPDENARIIPLFSTPARSTPPGLAVVRAQLRLDDETPAAWAGLEVQATPNTAPAHGIADARGRVVVFFPYPEPVSLFGSPAGGPAKVPLSDESWTITLRASLPLLASPPSDTDALPELDTFLDQVPARLFRRTSPLMLLTQERLEYGRELVLRTSREDPDLFVSPL